MDLDQIFQISRVLLTIDGSVQCSRAFSELKTRLTGSAYFNYYTYRPLSLCSAAYRAPAHSRRGCYVHLPQSCGNPVAVCL